MTQMNQTTQKIYFFVYYSFLITSAILFTISFFSSGSLLFNTSIAGYLLAVVSLLLIMIFSVSSLYQYPTSSVFSILLTLGPFFFIFFLIGLYLYFLITYKDLILDGNASPSFYTFQHISILLMVIQLVLFTYGTDAKTGKLSKINMSLIYLLCVIHLFILYTIRNILVYFTTDGFKGTT